MKILVCVKRVLDPQVKARVKADGSGVDLANAKMTMNPFDENALEEALRLREAGSAEEIVVVSIGGGKTRRHCDMAWRWGQIEQLMSPPKRR